jgi:hypothetical protein
MPGLVGFIGTQRSTDDAALLRRMLTTIKHQPSYVSGDYIDESLGCTSRGPRAPEISTRPA